MKKVLALLLLSSLAAPALADECALTIEGNDAMQFNQQAMSVPATCKEVTVTLNHTGKLPVANMGHNWVLANTADYQAVATAGHQRHLQDRGAGGQGSHLLLLLPRPLRHDEGHLQGRLRDPLHRQTKAGHCPAFCLRHRAGGGVHFSCRVKKAMVVFLPHSKWMLTSSRITRVSLGATLCPCTVSWPSSRWQR